MTPSPANLTVSAAAVHIRSGALSPVELIDACLERIEQLNPILNAFLVVAAEQARAAARRAADALAHGEAVGPLHGIPVGVKDLIDVAGMTTTGGSAFFAGTTAAADAAVIARLKAHGAIVIGKTHLQEFGFSSAAPNEHFGVARNPWNPDLSPGGSSGGSGAAVAAGMCPAALGTDTGGSVRLPAALCGLTGLRPAVGLLPGEGVIPRSETLDTVGPIARTAEDVALLFDAMAGADSGCTQHIGAPVSGLRLGVPSGSFFREGAQPEVLAALDAALKQFEKMGIACVEVDLNRLDDAIFAGDIISVVDPLLVHGERLAHEPERFAGYIRSRLEAAQTLSAVDYARAVQAMRRWQRELAELFGARVDLLVTPTTPVATHPIAPTEPLSSPSALPRYVYPFSTGGVSALSVPCGFTTQNMPIGMQLVGPDPCALLSVAHAYQQRTDWHLRRPALVDSP